ncbi:MAG: T9SS type A sorting domain-containing protein [Ferruginibacter sp.]
MKQLFKLSCLLLLSHLSLQQGFSQSTSWKGTVSVNWNLATNWTNGIPDNTKDVFVGDANFTGAFQPKVNVGSSCKSITVGGSVAATLTMAKTLTISGGLAINANGTFIHPAATMFLAGDFTNNGSYSATATTSRILFNGSNQVIGGSAVTDFRALNISATTTISLAQNVNITGTSSYLYIYGVVDPGAAYSITSNRLTKVYANGKIKVNAANFSSNYNLTGATTLYAGSIVEYASTTVNQVVSAAYSYSTLILSGTGTKSLTANLPLLYGKNAANGKILVSSGVTFDLGMFTANRAANAAGGELNLANGATLKIGGLSNFPINFFTRTLAVASTVEYNGADQTVSAQTYGNLLFSSPGIKTAITACNVMGDLTIAAGTFNTNATVVTHSIAGNFIMTGGAITAANCTFTLNGTANQSINVGTGISKLNVNNTGGTVNLATDVTINTLLNFTNGNIITGNYNLIIPAGASVTGASQTTGWVNGNLQKNIISGSAIFKSFEIGGASYSPANILFASVSIAGTITASTGSTDQPEIDYSGIDPAKSVNRYWTLNNAGIVFTNATAIFNWTAGDVDAGATTSNFKTGLFNGTSWMLPSTSSPLPTSIQVTGLTSMGDFSIGEIIGKSTWTGAAMTSDWFTPKNWLGLIPSTTDPTLIPNGISAGRLYPVIIGGTAIVNDLTVEAAASVTVSSTLKIAGVLVSQSNITASAGTVEFNGSASQTIASNAFAANTIRNLIVNSNLSLDDVTIITGTLSVGNGKTFSTNDVLKLKSDATGTARIASLPVDGSGNATAFITGNVSIERYIPARKAWRLLSAPIDASATTTLQDAWQEGAYVPSSLINNPNPNPGYGVHICGGTPENGFDQSLTNSATVKVYNNAVNGFVPLPPTPGTFTTLNSYTGYLVYIRGDRGIDLSQGNNAATTSTTLRMRGPVKTGNQTSTVGATNFTVVGNPYPSPIDFSTLTRNNVKNAFYVWDPKLAGTNGLGGYVTVSWNSSTNSYDVTTSASPVSQYIPSGEAILVESQDGITSGSITIKESDKTANGSDLLFGRPGTSGQKLRVNLYEQNNDGTSALLDGALITYADVNSNNIDRDDVKKITTAGENIGIQTAGQTLAIERRKTISENEISVLHIAEMKQRHYKLDIIAEQLDKPGFTALLQDKYSSELNNTVLNANGSTEVLFSVTENPASYASDRFSIIFKKNQSSIFAFKSTVATQQERNIAVEWQVENEVDVRSYSVEGSVDGNVFSGLSQLPAKAYKSGIATYAWFDLNVSKADHYYRIRAVSTNGEVKYSNVAKVTFSKLAMDPGQMTISPNPVQNNVVLFQLINVEKGSYLAQVFNINGQMVNRLSLQHQGGDMRFSLPLGSNLPSGKYQLKLTGGNKVINTPFIKE